MEISGDKGVLSGEVRVSTEGTIIRSNESKSVESSNLGSNDKVPHSHRWESWGVMNMVGRLLGGKLYVDDDEVKDLTDSRNGGEVNVVGGVKSSEDLIGEKTSDNQGEVNLAVDMNAREDVMGESASANGSDIKRMDINSESAKLDLDCPVESNINGNQDLVSHDIVPDGNLETEEINNVKDEVLRMEGFEKIEEVSDVKADVMIPKGYGNQDLVSHDIVPDGNLETEEINNVKDEVLRTEGFEKTEEVSDVKADVMIPKGDGQLDLHINDIVPEVTLELGENVKADSEEVKEFKADLEEVNDVKADMLIPKEYGRKIEKEEEYNVSDLVWGKVRSHPWWPGQIYAPSAASDNAKKYFKKENYLVAYFGDQSFAWNDESKLMPFRKYFSEMVKQTNTDRFSHALSCALDEAARRIEFGLSCPCWPQEVRDEKKFQVVENTGIREESSIIAGGDNVSSATTFLPGDVIQFLESLAKFPQSNQEDRLEFTIAKAELQAYTRWKGYHELPVFEECIGLSEGDNRSNATGEGGDPTEVPVHEAANNIPSKRRKSTADNGSSGDEERPKRKEKFMSVLLALDRSCSQNNDKVYVRKTSKRVISSSKSPEMVGDTCSNSSGKKQKTLQASGAVVPASGIAAKAAKVGAGEAQVVEIISSETPTPEMVLSELILTARRPLQRIGVMLPVVGWLREFRNLICLEKPSLSDQGVDLGKQKEE